MKDEESLLKLYGICSDRANLLQTNLHTYIKFHMGLNVAVIGGTFVLLAQEMARDSKVNWFIPLLLISSGLSIAFLAGNGWFHTLRAHDSWLINISTLAKLENALGLDAPGWNSKLDSDHAKKALKWRGEALIHGKYSKDRNNFDSSRDFVEGTLNKSAQHARNLLVASVVVGGLFFLAGVATGIWDLYKYWSNFTAYC